MGLAAQVFVGLVAVLHLFFLVLESFLWQTPFGLKFFKTTQQQADETAVLAKNQGLYNGFLAAGLIWTFFMTDPAQMFSTRVFFLVCVVVAGVVGAITAKASILFVQGLPAAIALGLVYAAR